MSDEYLAHVRREELRYLCAYEEWERSLSPEDRAALKGAAAPDIEDYESHNTKREVLGIAADVADSSLAVVLPNLAQEIDGPVDELQDLFGLDGVTAAKVALWAEQRINREAEHRKARVLVRVAGAFLNASNPKLLSAGLAFASDLAVTAGLGNMQEWASQNGVSRAAVSKVAKKWQEELELPVASHMKGAQACASYAAAQRQKHWRKNLPKNLYGNTTRKPDGVGLGSHCNGNTTGRNGAGGGGWGPNGSSADLCAVDGEGVGSAGGDDAG
jgi:hypothetical protein